MADACGADIQQLSDEQRATLAVRFPFLSVPAPDFPLHEAARRNDYALMESLLTEMPPRDVNARDAAGQTALHVAAAAFSCEV
jgi:ankyrin repeat protein